MMNNMKNAIVLFGKPGCGKGTLGKFLGSFPGICHYSIGDQIRKFPNDSELGQKVFDLQSKGFMIPDETVMEIVQRDLEVIPDNTIIILDGLPRTKNQPTMLDKIINVKSIIKVNVLDSIAKERIINRAKSSGREDDCEEIFNTRMSVFYNDTIHILEHYKNIIPIYDIDGSESQYNVTLKAMNFIGTI